MDFLQEQWHSWSKCVSALSCYGADGNTSVEHDTQASYWQTGVLDYILVITCSLWVILQIKLVILNSHSCSTWSSSVRKLQLTQRQWYCRCNMSVVSAYKYWAIIVPFNTAVKLLHKTLQRSQRVYKFSFKSNFPWGKHSTHGQSILHS